MPKNSTLANVYSSLVIKTNEGCWNWNEHKTYPYGYGYLYNPETKRTVSAHRASWTLHKGPIPIGLWVLHKCDNPPCTNPDHLFLGTVKDNVRDAVNKGRWANKRGSNSPNHKLSDDLVAKARTLYHTSEFSINSISKSLGVHRRTLSRAIRGQSWEDTPAEPSNRVTSSAGIMNGHAKLSEIDVIEIRMLRDKKSCSVKELAELFNVAVPTIYAIITRRTWKHL